MVAVVGQHLLVDSRKHSIAGQAQFTSMAGGQKRIGKVSKAVAKWACEREYECRLMGTSMAGVGRGDADTTRRHHGQLGG